MSNFGNSNSPTKNKPKGNPFPTQQPTNKMVLEVPTGVNIIQWVEDFAQRKEVSLAILTGTGSISEVVLKHKGSQLESQEFKEELDLVSFSGAYILSSPPGGGSSNTSFFNASLLRNDGSAIKGSALHMVGFGPVQLSVFIFNNPKFFKVMTIV